MPFSVCNVNSSDITQVVFTSAWQQEQFSFQLDDVALLLSKPGK